MIIIFYVSLIIYLDLVTGLCVEMCLLTVSL